MGNSAATDPLVDRLLADTNDVDADRFEKYSTRKARFEAPFVERILQPLQEVGKCKGDLGMVCLT